MNPNKPVNRKTHLRWNRSFVLVVSVLVLLVGIVGASLAYLSMKTEPVKNEFAYGKVSCEVLENFDGTVKNNVRIKNTGNIPAYIRARVVVTWKNENGDIYGTKPVLGSAADEDNKNYDYSFDYNPSWICMTTDSGGLYFYFPEFIGPDAETDWMLYNFKKSENANVPEGYDLSVEILADAIQSEPVSAVEEAWGVTVRNGRITVQYGSITAGSGN